MKDLTSLVMGIGLLCGLLLGMLLQGMLSQNLLEENWCEAQKGHVVDSLCIRDSLVVQYPDWLRPRPYKEKK